MKLLSAEVDQLPNGGGIRLRRGCTLGGGLYTGYSYVGGIDLSRMLEMKFATVLHPNHAAGSQSSRHP